jgi:HEAT repeat protein
MLKQTWLPNSKKCLRASLSYSVILLGVYSSSTLASIPNLVDKLKADIHARTGTSFEVLLRHWETTYGTSAFHPLLKIVSNTQNPDSERYIALMSAAKLGGSDSAPLFVPFLKDPSWMIRSGALRVLSAFSNPVTAEAILPLLRDPALVVRAEAVDAVLALQPKGAVEALISTISDPANYHGGKAETVPQRALRALAQMKKKEAAPQLVPLLRLSLDSQILMLTVQTLETLTGKKSQKGLALADQIQSWTKPGALAP